jgi:hypothetical protein
MWQAGIARKCIIKTVDGRNYFAIGFPNRSGGYEIRNAYFKGCISPKDISVISKGNEDLPCI